MRSRYVSKCKCKKYAVVIKNLSVSNKGVIDIQVGVNCSICGKPYKEVGPKMTKMVNPDIKEEIIDIPEIMEATNEDSGSDIKEGKSPEEQILEEEQVITEEETDSEGALSDETQEEGEVEKTKSFKERLFRKGKKPGNTPKLNEMPNDKLW